ncbi:MAG: hypothetical protein N3B68_10490 [Anaerolineae bacterium]|nr:hypothetical protein [Anaerolineae bacterium]
MAGGLTKHAIRNTELLLWAVVAWEALLVVLLSPLSATGPLAGLGWAERLGLDEAGRVGRIVMLYHSLAVPFVAALVYLILDALPFEAPIPRLVRPAVTAGYLLTSVGGLSFAYLRAGPIAHGAFLVGLSLTFYAGAVLWWGLRPAAADARRLERWAFWLMALYTLVSAAIGGAVGAYFGSGFEAFLAEDVLRAEHDLFQRAVIAHLHIMLTLIDIALLLLVARRVGLAGGAYRVAMPLIIAGMTIITFATWSVMVIEGVAHKIINVGAVILLAGAAIVALYGMRGLIRERPDWPAWRALLADPVRFGMLFHLLFVNLVVTAPGVWVAVHLEAVRAGDPAWERTFAVGHWHVLATLSAAVGFLLVVDRLGAQGWLRRAIGWGVLVGSVLAFSAVQFYLFRQPGTAPARPVLLTIDAGVGLFLLALALWVFTTKARSP